MHFTCRSFIGSPDTQNWSQYWENEPDDLVLAANKGHLFGLISLSIDSENQDIKTIGHDMVFEINQTYFSTDATEDIVTSLKKTINSISGNPLFSQSKKIIIIAVVVKEHLYLASFGNAKVILKRQDKISTLLTSEEGTIESIFGGILPEDKILLITDCFYQKVTWEKIKTFLVDEKVQNIEENFMSELFSLPSTTCPATAGVDGLQSNLAAAFIQTHADEPVDIVVEEKKQAPVFSRPKIKFKIKIPIKNIIARFTNKKSITVSPQEVYQVRKRKKLNLFIIILLIIGLSISSYLGFQKNKTNQIEAQYLSFKAEVDKKINNAVAVKNLNLDSALGLARESQTIIQKMTALKVHLDEVAQYQSQINLLLSQTGDSNNYTPPLFYDTSLIVNNPHYSKILLSKSQLYILDTTNGRLDSIDISQKSNKNLSISDKLKTNFDLVENGGNIYVVNDTGLFLVSKSNLESKLTFSDIKPTDYSFWNSAFYILDNSNSTIWKYAPNSSGFSPPQKWLKENEKVSTNATSLAINGKIWVLAADGKITPFITGKKDNFKPSQTATITQASNLVTTPEDSIIAFTDSDNLIYIYKKSGELLAKYNLDNFKISDIAIEEKSGNLFVLSTDQKIYKINF